MPTLFSYNADRRENKKYGGMYRHIDRYKDRNVLSQTFFIRHGAHKKRKDLGEGILAARWSHEPPMENIGVYRNTDGYIDSKVIT